MLSTEEELDASPLLQLAGRPSLAAVLSLAWTSDANGSQLLCELVVPVYRLLSLRHICLICLGFFFLPSTFLYPASLSSLPLDVPFAVFLCFCAACLLLLRSHVSFEACSSHVHSLQCIQHIERFYFNSSLATSWQSERWGRHVGRQGDLNSSLVLA